MLAWHTRHATPGSWGNLTDVEMQTLSSMAGGGGTCTAALASSCAGAKRASTGNCFVCAGQHQSSLLAAGCTNADITTYCSH
jgi:hypothetical protein